jgi:hypothetical protein
MKTTDEMVRKNKRLRGIGTTAKGKTPTGMPKKQKK